MDKKVEGGEGVQVQTSWMCFVLVCFVFVCASISSYVFLFIYYWSFLDVSPSTHWPRKRIQEVAGFHGILCHLLGQIIA